MPRHRRPASVEPENQMTSMLDLIFNILFFFIMTFNPPKPEKNFDISLPAPRSEKQQDEPSDGPEVDPFSQLNIILTDGGVEGAPRDILIEGQSVAGGLPNLSRAVRNRVKELSTSDDPLRSAMIVAGAGIKYRYVIEAVDACSQAGLTKIGFSGVDGPAP